jgi:hypothetical protein
MTLTMSIDEMGDDEIFYSDDESSDGEIFKASQFSRYFSAKSESIFTSRLRHNSAGVHSPDTTFNSPIYIDSPINQISSGIGNLLRVEEGKGETGKTLSYSAMIKKKDPLANNTQINNMKTEKPRAAVFLKGDRKTKECVKAAESALSAGYRFKAKDPVPDPRYPADQQVMIGPIPGTVDHDAIYNNLRSIFQSRGPVCFMFIHKSAVKDLETGNPVKFGYVVFAEKGIAQKVLKEGGVTFGGGYQVKVKGMGK